MGVIRPPWVDKDWFTQCPFNYCDHFGDQFVLANVCRICKVEIKRDEFYRKSGKDPHDMKNVFQEIGDNFAYALYLLEKQAKEMGIDLDNLADVEETPEPDQEVIFQIIQHYGQTIEQLMKQLFRHASPKNIQLFNKAFDVLSHSRYYIIAKTHRAYSSRFEESKDPDDDLNDSKTSAFFAYIAIVRNRYALKKLSQQELTPSLQAFCKKIEKLSIDVAQNLQQEFFPKDQLSYSEFGCESYNKLFRVPSASQSKKRVRPTYL